MQTLVRRARPVRQSAGKPGSLRNWEDFQPALAGGPLHPASLMNLQRLAGNSAVSGLVSAEKSKVSVQRCGDETHPGCPCAESLPASGPKLSLKVEQTAEPPAPADLIPVQREKIDYRELTWSDFKGKAPKRLTAVTFSDIHKIPKKVTASKSEDAGSTCSVGKKTKPEFKATIWVDSTALDGVKAYMDQKKSGANADYKSGLAGRTAKTVKACTKHFTDQEAVVRKQASPICAAQVAPCQKAFKDGIDPYTFTLDERSVTITEAKNCAKKLPAECKEAFLSQVVWGSFSSGDITAETRASCSADFKTAVAGTDQLESQRLLRHEQRHFDITNSKAIALSTELRDAAQMLQVEETGCGEKEALAKAKKAFNGLEASKNLQGLWDKARSELAITQTSYDDQTNHGIKAEQQKEWDEKFEKPMVPAVTP